VTRSRLLIIAAAFVAILAGLGLWVFLFLQRDRTADLSGEVTVNGKPLPAGIVSFHGRNPTTLFHATVEDGRYQVKVPYPGEEVVATVDTTSVGRWTARVQADVGRMETRRTLMGKLRQTDDELSNQIAEGKERLKTLQDVQKRLNGFRVDDRFTDRATSPLKYTLQGGKQTIDLRLSD
jgi:hypothetical protein